MIDKRSYIYNFILYYYEYIGDLDFITPYDNDNDNDSDDNYSDLDFD